MPHCPNCGARDRRPVGRADRRPGAGAARGHAVHGARAGRARPQGRVRQAARGAARGGLRARAGSTARCAGSTRRSSSTSRSSTTIAVVVDRLIMRTDVRKRLADSIETAVALAEGIVVGRRCDRRGTATQRQTLTFSEKFACLDCGISMPELEPRIFSFNSPHGACPRCTGSARSSRSTPTWSCPTRAVDRARARSRRGRRAAPRYYEQMTAGARGALRRRPRDAVGDADRGSSASSSCTAPAASASTSRYRNRYGRERAYGARFEGIVPNLERRYRETDSERQREKIEEFMACGRARPAAARGCGPSRWRCWSRAPRSTSSARCRRGGAARGSRTSS